MTQFNFTKKNRELWLSTTIPGRTLRSVLNHSSFFSLCSCSHMYEPKKRNPLQNFFKNFIFLKKLSIGLKHQRYRLKRHKPHGDRRDTCASVEENTVSINSDIKLFGYWNVLKNSPPCHTAFWCDREGMGVGPKRH